MIKVFITIGTTPFDELIKLCDKNIDLNSFQVLAQISDKAKYRPKNIEFIEFTNKIMTLYNKADIIISHAGAGSIYNLLELQKKSIFVPNFIMKDGHQNDICKFIENNNYAKVMNLKNININTILKDTYKKQFNKYKKQDSDDLINEIITLIEGNIII